MGFISLVAFAIWFEAYEPAENALALPNFFLLAQVVAIFSGFGLVAGFTPGIHPTIRRYLRIVATLYLLSALAFTMHALLMPALVTREFEGVYGISLVAITAFTWGVGIGSFCCGTLIWAVLIPRVVFGLGGNEQP